MISMFTTPWLNNVAEVGPTNGRSSLSAIMPRAFKLKPKALSSGTLVEKGGGAGALSSIATSCWPPAYELIYHEPTLAYGRSRRKAVAWDATKPCMLDEPGFRIFSKWP